MRIAAATAAVDAIVGRLADALGTEGRARLGLLDDRHDRHQRHVERRRQQIVGEAGVAYFAIDENHLFHDGEADALRDTALDLPERLQRVQQAPHLLRGGDFDHAHQPELDVDVDNRTVRGERERHVGVALAVVVEGKGRGVTVDDGLIEIPTL